MPPEEGTLREEIMVYACPKSPSIPSQNDERYSREPDAEETMRAAGNSERMTEMASMPLMSGMRKSMRVTSGRCRRKDSIASRPVVASPTKLMSDWPLRTAETPSRISG